MKGKKDLRAYLSQDPNTVVLLAVAFGFPLMLCGGELLRLGFGLFFQGLIYLGIYLLRAESRVRKIEREGKLDSVLQDFGNAKSMLDNHLYLGEIYLFVRGSERVIRYDEVCQICPYTCYNRQTKKVLERGLAVKLNSGKGFAFRVFGYASSGSPREEDVAQLRDAIALICSHNPEIQSCPEIDNLDR